MTTKFVLTVTTLILTFGLSFGQISESDNKENKSFAIQTDAFDLMANGFSIGANYTFSYNRIFIATGKNELPDFLNPMSTDFYEKRIFFIQAGYYRFLKKPNRLFVGFETIFQQMEISTKTTDEIQENPVLRIAPMIGYEWIPIKSFNKFTITPWISERFPIYSKSIDFQSTGKSYKTADFNFLMGLNIGYKF